MCFSCIGFPLFLCMFTCLYFVFVTSCDPQLFIFNLCSIYQSSTALCVAALFCSFILIFAAWHAHTYRSLPASEEKTCPDFSLYTNKFFCVENHRIVCFWFFVSIIPVPCLPSVYPVLWAISLSHHHFSTIISFWLCCHLLCPSLCSGSLYNAHNLQLWL